MVIKFKTTFEKNTDNSSGTISNEDGAIEVEFLINEDTLKGMQKKGVLQETKQTKDKTLFLGEFTLIP